MGDYVRIVRIGGNLTVTIPRALARELGLSPRMYVEIWNLDGGVLALRPVAPKERPHGPVPGITRRAHR